MLVKLPDDEPLNGMQAIADWMGYSRPTIHRWVREYGLPVLNRGPGRGKRVFTTKNAVRMWVLAISKPASKYPTAGPPNFVPKEKK